MPDQNQSVPKGGVLPKSSSDKARSDGGSGGVKKVVRDSRKVPADKSIPQTPCQICWGPDNEEMVQCDECDKWNHFSCVGVQQDIANKSWSCPKCVAAKGVQRTWIVRSPQPVVENAEKVKVPEVVQKAKSPDTSTQQKRQSTEDADKGSLCSKSKKSEARALSVKSGTSQKSVKLQLQKLEEQKALQKAIDEREYLRELEYLEKKYGLLEQLNNQAGSASSQSGSQASQPDNRVQQWVDEIPKPKENVFPVPKKFQPLQNSTNNTPGSIPGTPQVPVKQNMWPDIPTDELSLIQQLSSSRLSMENSDRNRAQDRVHKWIHDLHDQQPEVRSKAGGSGRSQLSEPSAIHQSGSLRSGSARGSQSHRATRDSSSLQQFSNSRFSSIRSVLPQIPEHVGGLGDDTNPQLDPIPYDDPLAHNSFSRHQIAARQAISKELPTFAGNPEEWPIFLAMFNSTTAMCGFSDEENLIRLQRSLKGRAYDTVKSRLMHPSNVPGVIKTLKLMFGQPEAIVQSLIRKINALPTLREDNFDALVEFAVNVQNFCATVDACELEDYMYNVSLLHQLVNKLPPSIKLDWARYRLTLPRVNLATFGNWVYALAEAASTVVVPLVTPEFRSTKNEVRAKKGNAYVNAHSELSVPESTSYLKVSPDNAVKSTDDVCIVCKSFRDARPRILIGLQHAQVSLVLKSREGEMNEPIGIKTRLGWTICGGWSPDEGANNVHYSCHVCSSEYTPEEDMHEAMKQYFSLDSMGICKSDNILVSAEEKRAQTPQATPFVSHRVTATLM